MLMPFIRHLGEILCVKEMKYDTVFILMCILGSVLHWVQEICIVIYCYI